MAFCTKCGKEIKEGTRFCIGCGAPVEGVITNTKSEEKSIRPVLSKDDTDKVINIVRTVRLDLQKMYADFIMIKVNRCKEEYTFDYDISYKEAEESATQYAQWNIENDIRNRQKKVLKLTKEITDKQKKYKEKCKIEDNIDISLLREENNNLTNSNQALERINEYGLLVINSRFVCHDAYRGNNEIKTIVIENNCEAIGEYAFAECPNLERVVFKSRKINIIPRGLFSGCTKLSDITLSEYTHAIDEMAFMNCTGIENLWIPYGIVILEAECFSGCTNMMELVIPDSVLLIGDRAFAECVSLDQIDCPDYLRKLGDNAFKDVACLWIIDRITDEMIEGVKNKDEEYECMFDLVLDYSNAGAREIKYLGDYTETGIYNPKDERANRIIRNAKKKAESNVGNLYTDDLLSRNYKLKIDDGREHVNYNVEKFAPLFENVQESLEVKEEEVSDVDKVKPTQKTTNYAGENLYEKYRTKQMNLFDYLWYCVSSGGEKLGVGLAILIGPIMPTFIFGTDSNLLCLLTMVAYGVIIVYGIDVGKRKHIEKYPERYDKNGKLLI